jgi:hypothetical protein
MPPRRSQQQLKAHFVRSSKVLSSSLKQLISNAGRAERVEAVVSSLTIHQDLYNSLVGSSRSSLQLYLDLSIPAKLWTLASCQAQLMRTDHTLTETVSAKALELCLDGMLTVDQAMPEDLKPAAWAQMLPVAENGKEGRPCYCSGKHLSSCFCKHCIAGIVVYNCTQLPVIACKHSLSKLASSDCHSFPASTAC